MPERNCQNHRIIIPPHNPEQPIQIGACSNCGEGKMFNTTPPPITVTPGEMKKRYLLQGIKTPFGETNLDLERQA